MQGSICCGYGSLGVMTSGYDCVMIPGATKAADKAPVPNSICGQGKGLVTVVAGMTTATVCSKYSQFYSRYINCSGICITNFSCFQVRGTS